ncbi:PP2C family protein-serine/threonine phosphatase [Cellulosilyticum ruminicola]|uniref:PP2C family protein-serine/threonine phosphatase n=1 Tax=Cellulosilyticum ruminicola TaxID=425254 RepID=UPI0006CFBFAA|nr:PP2C family serine/threonine-protein phosphatase [Cellulosilyticum ruminicola]
MEFETMTYTNKGGRRHNEDFVGYLDEAQKKVWVVADGLGGWDGSKMSAHIAGETVLSAYKTCENMDEWTLKNSIEKAHEFILEAQKQAAKVNKMRTTIVVAAIIGEQLHIGNVGNSRLYYFRKGKSIETHKTCDKQVKLLGSNKRYQIEEKTIDLQLGDAFLLCSDGFWKQIAEMEMLIDLNKSQTVKEWIRHLLIRLISRSSGKYDNYTVCGVLVK